MASRGTMDEMDKICAHIAALYGLKLAFHEKVEKGFLSENHVLADSSGQKFFLKKYRFDNATRLIEIHAAKELFSHGGIPVIMPIPLLDGQTFFDLDGAYYALFPFVEGRQYERGSMPRKAIISLGKMLARIHLIGKGATLPINDFVKLYDTKKRINAMDELLAIIDAKEKSETLSDFDVDARRGLIFKKRLLGECPDMITVPSMPNDHLLHGDFLDLNVFFDEYDEVSHVFDFEKTGYGPRVFEIFRCMMYSLVHKPFPDSDMDNARTFLEAYDSVYPIGKEEAASGIRLFFSKAAHGHWVESEHYLKGNNRVDLFLNSDKDRLEYFYENFSQVEKRIIG